MTPTSPLIITGHAENKVRGHAHKDEGHSCLKLSDDGALISHTLQSGEHIIKLLSPPLI